MSTSHPRRWRTAVTAGPILGLVVPLLGAAFISLSPASPTPATTTDPYVRAAAGTSNGSLVRHGDTRTAAGTSNGSLVKVGDTEEAATS